MFGVSPECNLLGFTRESWRLWVVVAKRRVSAAINVSVLRHVGSDVRRLCAMVHRGDKYQGDPFLVLGARLDVLEQQVALSLESFLLMLWFLCKRPLVAALLA